MADSIKQPENRALEFDSRKDKKNGCEFDFTSFEAKRHAEVE